MIDAIYLQMDWLFSITVRRRGPASRGLKRRARRELVQKGSGVGSKSLAKVDGQRCTMVSGDF